MLRGSLFRYDGWVQDAPIVRVANLSKSFGGSKALDGVSVEFLPGEIHALVGENGAGKSTFIRILGGHHRPDSGEAWVSGQPLHFGSVERSEAMGISVVHQESTAFLDLSVEDNLFVGREPRRFGGMFIDHQTARQKAKGLLDQIGAHVPLGTPLSDVSLAQRQLVAIARALSFDSKMLILDEPSASLSHRETDRLHEIVRTLKSSGMCVVYVSHRLDEVVALADRVTVLRDGSKVVTLDKAGISKDVLIQAMVGRALESDKRLATESPRGKVALSVKNLCRAGEFRDVSFDVREGEILGLGGLVGSGRTEVARTIFGIDRADSGTVLVEDKELPPGSIQGAVGAGVALVPEDRQHQGLVLEQFVGRNIVMSVRASLTRLGLIDSKREAEVVTRQMTSLAIKAASPKIATSSLSGGNQQKVVFAKWLATTPRVLILDEPTRGVDVGSKAEIHGRIRELARQGAAVLVISSDLPELLALSDRIVVMREGTVVGEILSDAATEQAVLTLAFESKPEAVS